MTQEQLQINSAVPSVKAALKVLKEHWTMCTSRKKSVVFLSVFLTFSEHLIMYAQVSLKSKISLPQLSEYRE